MALAPPHAARAPARATTTGATLLVFRHSRNDPNNVIGVSEAMKVDPLSVPWEMAASDPNIAHLRIARKMLRFGPDDSSRTYLLLGLPHGMPPADRRPPRPTTISRKCSCSRARCGRPKV
jgi:hypothetical protein